MTHSINRLFTVALSFAVIGGLAAPMEAFAQDSSTPAGKPAMAGKHHHHGDGKYKEAHEQFMKDLNLTDQQKAQFKAAHEKFRKENAASFESMKAKHEKLKALGTDPANEAQRKQLHDELRQERKAMMEKRKASTQGILTPDQQAKWDAKKSEMRAKRQEFHKNHPSKSGGAQTAQ